MLPIKPYCRSMPRLQTLPPGTFHWNTAASLFSRGAVFLLSEPGCLLRWCRSPRPWPQEPARRRIPAGFKLRLRDLTVILFSFKFQLGKKISIPRWRFAGVWSAQSSPPLNLLGPPGHHLNEDLVHCTRGCGTSTLWNGDLEDPGVEIVTIPASLSLQSCNKFRYGCGAILLASGW